MKACALNKECVATGYTGDTCYLKDKRGLAKPNPDVIGISVIRRDDEVPSGPLPSAPSSPSGFATITVTVAPTPSPTAWEPFPPPNHPPRPKPKQLLVNPSFEDETLDTWTIMDDYIQEGDNLALVLERSDNDFNTGNYSLRVLQNDVAAGWRLTVGQSKIKVKPLAEYNISLWVKDHSALCMIKFFWNKIQLSGKCEGTYGWSQCSKVLPSWMTDGSDGDWGDLTAFISCPSHVSGRFYIDDFTMTEIPNPINEICVDRPCSDEIEESPDRWTATSGGEDAGN
ncbi:hypothetical protein G6514_008106 [Epicoccum nigrum]|nr:hypothetical protein G6514_008106 [Epicoccum nigrum]